MPFKVAVVGTNWKPVCDFLLVINTNWWSYLVPFRSYRILLFTFCLNNGLTHTVLFSLSSVALFSDYGSKSNYGYGVEMLQKKSRRSSKDVLPELSEVLHNLKPSEFKDKYLSRYKVSTQVFQDENQTEYR